MKKIVMAAGALILSASLCGCVLEPSPYYVGNAPYYGTTYMPPYAYGTVAVGGYYPYHKAQHIYSHYDTDYWHQQRSAQQQRVQPHSAPQRGDERRRQ